MRGCAHVPVVRLRLRRRLTERPSSRHSRSSFFRFIWMPSCAGRRPRRLWPKRRRSATSAPRRFRATSSFGRLELRRIVFGSTSTSLQARRWLIDLSAISRATAAFRGAGRVSNRMVRPLSHLKLKGRQPRRGIPRAFATSRGMRRFLASISGRTCSTSSDWTRPAIRSSRRFSGERHCCSFSSVPHRRSSAWRRVPASRGWHAS